LLLAHLQLAPGLGPGSMATGEGGWFGATFGALVPGLTKDEAGSAREQPAPNGAWFGWVPAVPGLPWVQFSARGG